MEKTPFPSEILVTDDDPQVRQIFQAALTAVGHTVRECSDGQTCLREVEHKHPDLIFCDLTMPGMSGIEVCGQIKGNPDTRHIPFIMITGDIEYTKRLEGIRAGADDYLNKPLSLAEVLARTESLLKSKRLDDEVKRQREVIDNLLAITTLDPEYAEDRDLLIHDFLARVAELLRARQATAFQIEGGQISHVVACHPALSEEHALSLIRSCPRCTRMLREREPIIIREDEGAEDSHGSYAGFPILSNTGELIAAVAAHGIPDEIPAESLKVLHTLAKRLGAEIQLQMYNEILEAQVAERTRDLKRALEDLSHANIALEHAQEETVFRLAQAAEFRNNETGEHLRRISLYSQMLGRAAGLSDEQINDLRCASLMHDIGKIAIPDSILLKADSLTDEEKDLMRTHTLKGGELLSNSDAPMLKMGEQIALNHHERWDGTGYPHGKSGEVIPLAARIVSVADVFDALISKRVYKEAWTMEESLKYLREAAGKQFDPELVETFLGLQDQISEVIETFMDATMSDIPAPPG